MAPRAGSGGLLLQHQLPRLEGQNPITDLLHLCLRLGGGEEETRGVIWRGKWGVLNCSGLLYIVTNLP
jgi:hypothetical protein